MMKHRSRMSPSQDADALVARINGEIMPRRARDRFNAGI